MPLRVIVTEGTTPDCTQAIALMDGFEKEAQNLLADKAYDSNEIVWHAESSEMLVVIPSKRNRKDKRYYDRALFRLRHLVENAFLGLKQWRGIATRYAKNAASFLAIVQIRCIYLWLTISCRHPLGIIRLFEGL
jgi:transposase